MPPQVVFEIKLKGLRDFLSQRSEEVAQKLMSYFDDTIKEREMELNAPLTEASLKTIKEYTDFWETGFTRSRDSSPPMKGHCEFYDSLIKQLQSGERIDFQRAFDEAQLG